jgi:putative ABC transport system permease protein
MNVFHKVARRFMRENRTRTVVTIVGVILSAAMFTAVTTFCTSLVRFMERTYIYENGDWHLGAEGGAEMLETIAADSRVCDFFYARQLGYAPVESENTYKPYLYLLGAQEAFFRNMPVHLSSGRLPEAPDEILLPQHLAENGGVDTELGQTLVLELGSRRIGEETLGQNNPFDEESGEVFVPESEQEYTVVGYYARPNFENYSAPGYTALTCLPAGGAQGEYEAYFHVRSASRNLETLAQDYEQWVTTYNWDVLMFAGSFRYGNFSAMISMLGMIFIFLILLGSVSLIYSVFSISVGERTRQYGLLASIGATRRQIRACVLHEAMCVSVIGIPIGLLCGIAGMAVTFHFVGDKFTSILSSPYSVTLALSPASLLSAAWIALVTVLISVWIPARRAMSVSAIEAIRQSTEITGQVKPVKTSRLIYRLFGLSGVLARKYYKRSRKKYRTTVISLAMSVILFISAASFCMYLRSTVELSVSTANYDLAYALDYDEDFQPVLEQIRRAPGVADASLSGSTSMEMLVPMENMTKEYRDYLSDRMETYTTQYDDPSRTVRIDYVRLVYLDEASYRALLTAQGIAPDTYLAGGNPAALVLNGNTSTLYRNNESGEMERVSYTFDILRGDIETLEVLTIPESIAGEGCSIINIRYADADPDCRELIYEYVPQEEVPEYDDQGNLTNARQVPAECTELALGARVDAAPLGISNGGDSLTLIYPDFMRDPSRVQYATLCVKSQDHELMLQNVESILEENGYLVTENNWYDVREQDRDERNIITIINVFSYGFIVLISLISAANVFNTISTNIALRRRDFAMLRSVGMEQRALYRMTNYECLLYGSRALLLGVPLAALVSYWIYQTVRYAANMQFTLPWTAVILAVVSVFAVVFVSMLYAMRRIRRDNPIDALKNENI